MITKIVPLGTKVLIRAHANISNLIMSNPNTKLTGDDKITKMEIAAIGDQVKADVFKVGACCLCTTDARIPVRNDDDPLDFHAVSERFNALGKEGNVMQRSDVHNYFLVDSYAIDALYTHVDSKQVGTVFGLKIKGEA